MSGRLPWSVRATDVVHRLTVYGLVGICFAGLGSIGYNLWSNSDYSKANKQKLTFEKAQYTEQRNNKEE
jgi:hypothetical protein